METDSLHTAVLFFSRSAEAERKHKTLLPGIRLRRQKEIHQNLISHSYDQATKSGLPVLWFTESMQQGQSFGERLSGAFEQLFAQGFEAVIAIGNDCPDLSHRDLKTASCDLKHHQMVLGPATDGGIYLLGLQKKTFKRINFVDFAWEGSHLFSQLIAWAGQKASEVSILKTKSDLDHFKDLLQAFKNKELIRQLLKTLLICFFPIPDWENWKEPKQSAEVFLMAFSHRGPPC